MVRKMITTFDGAVLPLWCNHVRMPRLWQWGPPAAAPSKAGQPPRARGRCTAAEHILQPQRYTFTIWWTATSQLPIQYRHASPPALGLGAPRPPRRPRAAASIIAPLAAQPHELARANRRRCPPFPFVARPLHKGMLWSRLLNPVRRLLPPPSAAVSFPAPSGSRLPSSRRFLLVLSVPDLFFSSENSVSPAARGVVCATSLAGLVWASGFV